MFIFGLPQRQALSTRTYNRGMTVVARTLSASGRRAWCRKSSSITAATLRIPMIGSSAALVVNCGFSIPHPVFWALGTSSTIGRQAYQSTRSAASSRLLTGTLVNKIHSTGSTPSGALTSLTINAHSPSVLAMLATRDARHPQRDGPGGNPHLRIPRRLLLLALFAVAFVDVGPDRHVPAAQVRQPPEMFIQLAFDLLDLLCVFPAQQTILAGTQYIETVVGVLVIQQLKGVGPRVENVHHPLARRRRANRFASSLPKPALAIRVFPLLLGRLLGRHLAPRVQNLAGQPQHLPGSWNHRQAVVAQISAIQAVADRPQILDALQRGVLQFRPVMQHQHHPRFLGHPLAGQRAVRRNHRLVRDGFIIHQPIDGLQLRGVLELIGERAARMHRDCVCHLHQPIRAAFVSQHRRSKVRASKGHLRHFPPHVPADAIPRLLAGLADRTPSYLVRSGFHANTPLNQSNDNATNMLYSLADTKKCDER